LSSADLAMYKAKEKGTNQYHIYSPELSQETLKLFSLEYELRQAIQNEEFELFYQPKVFNQNGYHLSGAEVLIRWQHPQKGMISPGIFIPLAEKTGLINSIGEWVMRKACEQMKQWQQQGYYFKLSVNLSSRQLTWSSIDKLFDIIEQADINSQYLEFEITETYVMQNLKEMSLLLQHIKDKQISIALDDFGLGYSCLAVLKSLPLNTLKIDKSLIDNIPHNLQEQAILESIVTVAKALNLRVVTEGIETDEQRNFLAQLQCDELQGFYFSKPLELSAFEQIYLSSSKMLAHLQK
jgi:EAL domain-containing protein (putative c-di-GMP-specific phosphodiesterase class I)